MNEPKRQGPLYDPGLCRCCGAMKKCRLLNFEYKWCGQKEIYSEMFVDCFGLLLSHLDCDPEERLVCATCVVRLRDACAFRRQVLQCEEKLLTSKIDDDQMSLDVQIKEETKDIGDEICPLSHEQTGNVTEHSNNDCGTEQVDCDADTDQVDYVDDVDELKIEENREIIPKLRKIKVVKKKKKKPKETKEKVKKKITKKKKLGEDLINMENQDNEQKNKPEDGNAAKPRILDDEQKAFLNTVTIVESSYVCPFDTSFSDYFCIYCRELFTDPCKLRDHTLEHDPATFRTVVTNKKLILVDIVRVDCRYCPEKIADIESLKHHIRTYHGLYLYDLNNEFLKFRLTIKNLTCIECNSPFRFFHALKKHMAEHFGTCVCDICGAHYFEERMLILHLKCHQRQPDQIFMCNECGKSFRSKHSRFLHISRMHTKEPAYYCNKCDDVFFTYALRYRHMIETHGQERSFPCEHCDRKYDTRKSLREHNRRSHLKIFKHQCDMCDKRFYLPSRLKEHMVTHTGERNFRCEYCGKTYPRLRGLKVHMQSHSSEKKYQCLMCSSSFTQNVNLKNHIKKQHQGMDVEGGYHC